MAKDTSNLKEAIAKRLRQAREASGLSQAQVAKRLGWHRPTISEIEAARRSVSAEEISGFATLYEVEATWIMEGSKTSSQENDKILLAARQLSKLKDKDLDRLMQLIQMLRGDGGSDARK